MVALLAMAGCEGDGGAAAADVASTDPDTGTIAETAGGSDTAAATDVTTGTDVTAGTDTAGGTDVAAATDTATSTDTATVDAGPAATTKWFKTCGSPVCKGWTAKPEIPLCTTEKLGDGCAPKDERCDPKDGCDALYLCAEKDPRAGPGGCPISLKATKKDIEYLSRATVDAYANEAQRMRLATWRYKDGDGSTKLGVMVDDAPQSIAVDGRGDRIDLYSYTSLAIAALQRQGRELNALKAKIDALTGEVGRLKADAKLCTPLRRTP